MAGIVWAAGAVAALTVVLPGTAVVAAPAVPPVVVVALPATGGAAGPPQAASSGTSSATRAQSLTSLGGRRPSEWYFIPASCSITWVRLFQQKKRAFGYAFNVQYGIQIGGHPAAVLYPLPRHAPAAGPAVHPS